MKRRICKIGTGEVISVGIIILLVFRFVSVYLNQEEKLHSELFMLFTEVVQEEKEQQALLYLLFSLYSYFLSSLLKLLKTPILQ